MGTNTLKIEEIEISRERLIEALEPEKVFNEKASFCSKVAYILNKYPETRNNDRDLAFKLWKEFYPEQVCRFNGDEAVTYKNFLILPKSYDIQRYRAHIQNDLGLFMALKKIRRNRKSLQLDWEEEMLIAKTDYPKISVYSDESGRNLGSLIIGSLWLYDRDQEQAIERKLIDIQNKHKCKKLKFSKIKENNIDIAKQLLNCLLDYKNAIAFKALIVEGYKDSGNKIFKAYKEHYIDSIEFEIDKKRLGKDNPKKISIIKDKEENIDSLEFESLKRQIRKEFTDKKIFLSDIFSLSMEKSVFLQIVDFFCGSINRKLSSTDNNVKDRLADYVFSSLEINEEDFTANNKDYIQIKVLGR